MAVDFENKRVYVAKNGKIMGNKKGEIWKKVGDVVVEEGTLLYPVVFFEDAKIEFNFDAPRRPCKWLMEQGFIPWQHAVFGTYTVEGKGDEDDKTFKGTADWHNHRIIDELWLWIFECLSSQEVFRAQRVCTKWDNIIG